MHGLLLRSGIRIPLTKYRPDSTLVSFWIDAPELAVGLNLPQWNTHSLFPTPHRSEIGHIGRLYLDGSYRYYAEVFPAENIDRLTLNFSVRIKSIPLGVLTHPVIRRVISSIRLPDGRYDTS